MIQNIQPFFNLMVVQKLDPTFGNTCTVILLYFPNDKHINMMTTQPFSDETHKIITCAVPKERRCMHWTAVSGFFFGPH